MKALRTTALGLAFSVVLVTVIAISIYSLQHPLPEPLGIMLFPGFLLNSAFHGGVVHETERDSTAFLNIVAWSLVLGTAAALWASQKGRAK